MESRPITTIAVARVMSLYVSEIAGGAEEVVEMEKEQARLDHQKEGGDDSPISIEVRFGHPHLQYLYMLVSPDPDMPPEETWGHITSSLKQTMTTMQVS
tara:strand:- start:1145 stop:1441 length:297 start_codon:yes stop_codon:yes gene_type:complete